MGAALKYLKAQEAEKAWTASVEERLSCLKEMAESTPDSIEDLEVQLESYDRQLAALLAFQDDIRANGINKDTVITLEAICPGVITSTVPLERFTYNTSGVNLDVSQESLSKGLWAVIGAMILALGLIIIKFVKALFDRSKSVEKSKREYEETASAVRDGYGRYMRVVSKLPSSMRHELRARRQRDGVYGDKYQYTTREHRVSQLGYQMFSRDRLYVDWVTAVNNIPRILETADKHYGKLYSSCDIVKFKWPEIQKTMQMAGSSQEAIDAAGEELVRDLQPVMLEMMSFVEAYRSWSKMLVLNLPQAPDESLDYFPENSAKFAYEYQRACILEPATAVTVDFLEHEVLEGRRNLIFPDRITDQVVKRTVDDLDRIRRTQFNTVGAMVDRIVGRTARAINYEMHRRWIVSTLKSCSTMYIMYNNAVDEANKTTAYFVRLIHNDVEILKELLSESGLPQKAALIAELDLAIKEFDEGRMDLRTILTKLNIDATATKKTSKDYDPAEFMSDEERAAADKAANFQKEADAEWAEYLKKNRDRN